MKRHLHTKILAVAAAVALGGTGIAQAEAAPESNAGAGSTPEQVNSAAGTSKDTSSGSTASDRSSGSGAGTSTSAPSTGSSAGNAGSSTATQSGQSTATGSTTAESTSGASATTPMSRDGIIRHEGDTYFVKEGRAQKVEDEMKLSEGITAQKNGKITLKDGTELSLDEGKMVTLEGKVVDTPAQVSSVVGNGNTTSTPKE